MRRMMGKKKNFKEDVKVWGEFKREMLKRDKRNRLQREQNQVYDERYKRNSLLPLIEEDEDFD